jgi:pilus assembly protein Flp/PilA
MFEILMAYVRSALKREEGQALVEYALILALVSVVAIAVLTALGTNIVAKLQEVVDALA